MATPLSAKYSRSALMRNIQGAPGIDFTLTERVKCPSKERQAMRRDGPLISGTPSWQFRINRFLERNATLMLGPFDPANSHKRYKDEER